MRGKIGSKAVLAGIVGLVATQPAQAEWLEATSKHFIVYANGSADDVRRRAEQLERFDGVFRYFKSLPEKDEDASNKLTVYVVADDAAVARLYGKGGENIAGFYQGRASGSVAYTTGEGAWGGAGKGPPRTQIILFHEYAHHLMLGNFAAAYPAWFAEGYAEFLSTANFDKDSVWIGGAAQHRGYELLMQKGLSAEQLLTMDWSTMKREQIGSLYARGWLMTHYMMMNDARRGQLTAYLNGFNDGRTDGDAARKAFGDLGALNKELNTYLGKKLLAYKIPLSRLPVPTVTLRPLRPGEKAMIGLRMRSDRGVARATAQPILAEALPIAQRYPDDPVVQGWLAEMALDAGRYDLADAAADRALAIDKGSAQALVYKAQVKLRQAREAKATDPAVWKDARSWLLKANRIDPNDAYALMLYYSSFGMARAMPTDNAKAALLRAHELVPQDPGVSFAYAMQSLLDDRMDDARAALRPLAYSAHSGPDNPAAKLLAQIAAGKRGTAAMAAAGAEQDAADRPE